MRGKQLLVTFCMAWLTVAQPGMSVLAAESAGGDAVELLLDRAAAEVEGGEYDKAAATLERALRIEPNDAEIWHLLGQVRLHQGQYRQAVTMAEKSNSLAGTKPDLQQRNAHLIQVAQQLSGQPGTPVQTVLSTPPRPVREESPVLTTATQPLPPPPPAVHLPLSADTPQAVGTSGASNTAGVAVLQIYDPTLTTDYRNDNWVDGRGDRWSNNWDDDRDDHWDDHWDDNRYVRADSDRDNGYAASPPVSVPLINVPLPGGAFRIDLLVQDIQDRRGFYKTRSYQRDKPRKHKKPKHPGKSRHRD